MGHEEGLAFGVATADHQCEAFDPAVPDIRDVWERTHGTPRGRATDFWRRWPEDVQLAADLGCRWFRFSVAWSRVEPRPGVFDPAALEHYRELAAGIRARGMEPLVTLHHFTWPLHVEDRGGLTGDEFPDLFCRYTERVVAALGDLVRYWITFNEPTMLTFGYTKPWWQRDYRMPPGLPAGASSDEQADALARLIRNLFVSNARARAVIRAHRADAMVGANPFVLGLPGWLRALLDWSIARARREGAWRRRVARLADRPRLPRGPADVVVAGLTATPERARAVDLSEPYHDVGAALLVPAASPVTAAADLAGQAVAVVAGGVHGRRLDALVPGARARAVHDLTGALSLLDAGGVVAVAADDVQLAGLAARRPGAYRVIAAGEPSDAYAAAVATGDQRLLELVNGAVRRFRAGDTAGPAEPPPPAPPGTALRRIQDRGAVVAAVRRDVPGLAFGEGAAEPTGREVDLAHEIAREVLGDPDKVQLRVVDPRSRLRAVTGGLGGVLEPVLRHLAVALTALDTNWWHLGMAGRLPAYLCPPEAAGQQDYVGVDYYWGTGSLGLHRLRQLSDASLGDYAHAPVWPRGMGLTLRRLARRFPGLAVVVVENGCVERAGGVDRATYLRLHLEQVRRAVRAGVPLLAYVCWSITSNREWGLHFDGGSDFGLYHIELDSDPELRRTPTDASRTYASVIREWEAGQVSLRVGSR